MNKTRKTALTRRNGTGHRGPKPKGRLHEEVLLENGPAERKQNDNRRGRGKGRKQLA